MTYTQEFFLCALKPKGDFPTMKASYIYIGLTISGILELLEGGFLVRDEKDRLLKGKSLENNLPHLKSLYEVIICYKKPKKIQDIVMEYSGGMGKKINTFIEGIGNSLVEDGGVTVETTSGIFGNKTKYIPNELEALKIIEKVRIEILKDGMMNNEIIILVTLLQRSNIIQDYFSKIENKKLKERLKEISKSSTHKEIKKIIDYIEAIWAAIIVT